MQTKHTPGPWTVTPLSRLATYEIHRESHYATLDERMANARLIASAPDLLAALVAVLQVHGYDTKSASPPTGDEGPTGLALYRARAAIARATGEGEA